MINICLAISSFYVMLLRVSNTVKYRYPRRNEIVVNEICCAALWINAAPASTEILADC